MLAIDKHLLHTNHNLVFKDNNYHWLNDDSFIYSNSELGNQWNSIEPLLKIYGFEIPDLIAPKYLKMAKEIGLHQPNWKGIIGKEYQTRLKNVTTQMVTFFGKHYAKPYVNFYKQTNEWIWSLQAAPLNRLIYNGIRASDANFKLPLTDEMINPVRYNRSKIKTGRLSVISGPQIMNMAKEKRKVLNNCHSIDFSSMEPLLLLNLMDMKVEGDLYEWVAKKCNLGGDRTYWKIAIISSIYGSKTVKEVNELFALDEWIKQIEKDIYIDEFGREIVENYFGRPIAIDGARENHLLNLWLQSSANEFAIKGFMQLFENEKDLIPHWLIHDSCIYSQKRDIIMPDEILIDNMKFKLHKELL